MTQQSSTQPPEETLLQSFPIRHLSKLGYAQGFTLWHYHCPSEISIFITNPEWHTGLLSMMAPGDRLMVSAPHGTGDFVCKRQSPDSALVLHLLSSSCF